MTTIRCEGLYTERQVTMQGAFELISSQCPKAVAGMLDGMARRLSAASAARANPNQ